jgi:hypothetical protein
MRLDPLIRRGPPMWVKLEKGEDPVAKPPIEGQCWALVANTGANHNRCDRKARPGALCCFNHARSREAMAQRLKARLDAEQR